MNHGTTSVEVIRAYHLGDPRLWWLLTLTISCGVDPFTVAQSLDEVRLDAAPADASDPALDAPAESAPTIDSGTGGADAEDADGGSGEDARPEADAAQEVEACSPVTHSDGLGQSWSDCAPLGTYDQAEAQAACEANGGSPCVLNACGAVCDVDPHSPGYCSCWVYAGALAGHVNNTAGCTTPATASCVGSDTWQ